MLLLRTPQPAAATAALATFRRLAEHPRRKALLVVCDAPSATAAASLSRSSCSFSRWPITSEGAAVAVKGRVAVATRPFAHTLSRGLRCFTRASDEIGKISPPASAGSISGYATMPPVRVVDPAEVVDSARVVVFSKTFCPFCKKVKELLAQRGLSDVRYIELDEMPDEDGQRLQDKLEEMTGQRTVPNVFVNGVFLGGSDDTIKASHSGKLEGMLTQTKEEKHDFDYDVLIIGGGSGGLAASKELARFNRKVAVCDFVKPSPPGTTWGLGGTCVNVGCIPKKLMHQASQLAEYRRDSESYGFPSVGENKTQWAKLVENVQNHIGSLNWGYKVELRDKKVKYLNEYATFVDPHTVKTVNKKGKENTVTSKYFIIATGGRPRYPEIPGAKALGITSDDLFSLNYEPGKTLLVGASYISLESAGFLQGMGFDVTVMVRSILLRGFDQQCANKIGDYMEGHLGINFVRGCVPVSMERIEEGNPGKIRVKAKYSDGTDYEDWFNTVVFAIGRDSEAPKLNLENAGVHYEKNGKIKVDDRERTNQEHIFAVGDVLEGKPELTPLAIQSGTLLARRICKVSDELTNYDNIPTTVFTPLEYGAIGLSEEDAISKYGEGDIEVYHKNFWPLEWTLPKRPDNACYAKLVCHKSDKDRVLGFHYLGPNAGEVTQGFTGMMVMGATKADFDRTVGIHPTTAETFTTLNITKSSGVDPAAAGC